MVSCNEKSSNEVMEQGASQIQSTETMEQDSALIHTVFFWLKEGVTEDQKLMFEAELGKLAKCPTIDKVWYGKPAMTPRDVVDNSYNYAWVVHFKNAADQTAYQSEPIHLAFIKTCEALWEKVQVYDSLVKKS